MSGLRLEVEMHIVTGAVTFIENVVRSVHKAGLTIDATVLEPIATGEAVLLPAERDMGVALADIGGGTTDVAIFVDGDVVYSSVIPVGGTHVTRDISIGLRCDPEEAERVKVLYGTCLVETVGSPQSDHFEMCCLGETAGRQIPRRILAEIVYPRMEELYEMVSAEIDKSGYHNLLPAGIVLSGGGSQIAGGTQLCQRVTGLPTRIGMPRDVSGLTEVLRSPVYATGVGLALYGARHSRVIPSREQSSEASAISVPAPITPLPPLGNFMKSLQQFFARFTGGSK
jgi:cell division protein FtsA